MPYETIDCINAFYTITLSLSLRIFFKVLKTMKNFLKLFLVYRYVYFTEFALLVAEQQQCLVSSVQKLSCSVNVLKPGLW